MTDINSQNNIPPRSKPPKRSFLKLFLKIILGILITILVLATGVGIGFFTANINARQDIADIVPPASSQIYDSAGNEIANIHAAENRVPVKIEQIPINLQHAFVAVEDNRFYEHRGVDPQGLLRAVYTNIVAHEIAEGGSTITQQLAKNAYLTQERTMKRKIQEVFLALQLEKQYTKQEILEMYLNQIYFGQGAYGVQAAARTYFGKDVQDLNLSECAMLAGIPKSPNYYSPFNNLDASKERRNVVLDQMVKYKYIRSTEADSAKSAEVVLTDPKLPEARDDAAYFINYVTQIIADKYGAESIYKDGMKIYTTIDLDMQHMAQAALLENLPTTSTDTNGIQQPQGALVVIDPKTGYIKAMVGGRGTDQFNRATMAERQPGSAFKPFVFIAALENNFTPDTIIEDSPITINGWSPQNDSRRFSGPVTLRTVATFSMNVPTVKIAQKLGMDKAIYYAQEMGISTFVLDGARNDRNLATSLGGLTRGVTPLEITSAYGTFANGGIHVPSTAIIKVLDRNGKVLEEFDPTGKQVVSAESAAALTSMLEDVILKGSGKRANIGRPAAGKTGTTSSYKDAWFVGYTPDLVAGVWIGNDDNSPISGGMMGGETPATVWNVFMQRALANVPVHDFDPMVVRRRSSKTITSLRDNNKKDNKKTDENNKDGDQNQQDNNQTPQRNGNSGRQTGERRNNQPQRSSEQPARTYTQPEQTYTPPEPAYTPPQPEPSAREYEQNSVPSRDAPAPGGGISKGRN